MRLNCLLFALCALGLGAELRRVSAQSQPAQTMSQQDVEAAVSAAENVLDDDLSSQGSLVSTFLSPFYYYLGEHIR